MVKDLAETEGTAFKPWNQGSAMPCASKALSPATVKNNQQLLFQLDIMHNLLFGVCKPQLISGMYLEILSIPCLVTQIAEVGSQLLFHKNKIIASEAEIMLQFYQCICILIIFFTFISCELNFISFDYTMLNKN